MFVVFNWGFFLFFAKVTCFSILLVRHKYLSVENTSTLFHLRSNTSSISILCKCNEWLCALRLCLTFDRGFDFCWKKESCGQKCKQFACLSIYFIDWYLWLFSKLMVLILFQKWFVTCTLIGNDNTNIMKFKKLSKR